MNYTGAYRFAPHAVGSCCRPTTMHSSGDRLDFGQDMSVATVVGGMCCTQAQPIQMKLADPMPGIIEHEVPDALAAGFIVVDRSAPRRRHTLLEIGAEVCEIIALGARVIVHDVQKDADAGVIADVHNPLQFPRASIRTLHGVPAGPVVTPVPTPGELGNWHQLDSGNPQFSQLLQPLDDGGKRPLGGKRPHCSS
jgi:hypothetical protein